MTQENKKCCRRCDGGGNGSCWGCPCHQQNQEKPFFDILKPEREAVLKKLNKKVMQDVKEGKIKVVPSPRQDWCGDCGQVHGYHCPKENQEKCICSSIGLNTPNDCPVHKNMWENQEKCWKCGQTKEGHTYLHEFSPIPENQESWEGEFARRFGDSPLRGCYDTDENKDNLELAIEFIRQLLSQEKQKIREKVEGMKQTELWTNRKYYPEELVNRNVAPIYNEALSDILSLLD